MSIPVGTVIHVSSGADRYTFVIDKRGMKTLRVNDRTWGKLKPALPSWGSITHFITAVPFVSDISMSMRFPLAVAATCDSVAAKYCLTRRSRGGHYAGVFRPFSFTLLTSSYAPKQTVRFR
jgi:hypothetical protein